MSGSKNMRPVAELGPDEAKKIQNVLFDIDDTITTGGKLLASAYSSIWALHDAGLNVIPVTGRPAGWCDLIVREWPVTAVIGENGAFTYYFENGQLKTFLHPLVDPDAQNKLRAVRDAALSAVPGCRVAKDQFSRIYDVAIDFREDEPRLPFEAADEICRVCREMGAEAKVSSIHVNAWFGKYDKVGMAKLFLSGVLHDGDARAHTLFFGDSPNDEPMFEYFPSTCAVANIKPFVEKIASLPAYVTLACGSDGFAEGVGRLLSLRAL